MALTRIKRLFFSNYKVTFKFFYYAMNSGYDLDYIYKNIVSK